jgi:hypothetical protein
MLFIKNLKESGQSLAPTDGSKTKGFLQDAAAAWNALDEDQKKTF